MLKLSSSMACCLLFAGLASFLPASSPRSKTPDVQIILDHMAAQRNAFNPKEIHDLGVRARQSHQNHVAIVRGGVDRVKRPPKDTPGEWNSNPEVMDAGLESLGTICHPL